MLSLLFIFFSFFVGHIICRKFLYFIEEKMSFEQVKWFQLSASLPLGFMATTSWVYFFYYCFQNLEVPLFWANMSLILPAILLFIFFPNRWSKEDCWYTKKIYPETLFFIFILIIGLYFFYHTIYFWNDHIVIGASVQSDFGPHTAMIRSFSVGKNIPTGYPLFPGNGVRYHFLFYFLVGNLEFLGLNLPQALNLPSLLTFISAFLLFFLWIKIITKKNLIAWLTIIFFLFRSSPALPYKIWQILHHDYTWANLWSSVEFIGLTENELWGIWGINVWANQRHLPMGFSILMIVLIAASLIYLPKNIRFTNLNDPK